MTCDLDGGLAFCENDPSACVIASHKGNGGGWGESGRGKPNERDFWSCLNMYEENPFPAGQFPGPLHLQTDIFVG